MSGGPETAFLVPFLYRLSLVSSGLAGDERNKQSAMSTGDVFSRKAD